LLIAGAAPLPSKKLADPYPTRSIMLARSDRVHGVLPPLQDNPIVVLTNAIFPLVAPISIVPVASDGGNAAPFEPPEASLIR
jgi:hypothetical protein